jgi:hypothetical protein
MQAARVRNFCAAQKCPDKCFNAVSYNTNVCLANPLSIGTNCCNTFKVYFKISDAVSGPTKRIPLLNAAGTFLYGYTNQTSAPFYSDLACTVRIGTIMFSIQSMYDTSVAYVANTGVEYADNGFAQVTNNVTFSWVDYSVAEAASNFKASLDIRLSYYQNVYPVSAYSGPTLSGKSYSSNGQLVNKKTAYSFKYESPSIQSVTFQLSDSV